MTKQIRTIVVAVDFSPHSQRALDEGISLARQFGASLVVFHCYELPLPGFGRLAYMAVPPDSYVDAIRDAALESTRRWAESARAQGVAAHAEISAGFAHSEIAALAEKLGADLIVIGTRGASGLRHVLLGSVAERTIRIAPCPVLTVKAQDAT